MTNPWLVFSRKMKWVLFGTVASVLGAAGTEATDTFPVSDHPWIALVAPVVVFLMGYIPTEPKVA